LELLLREIPNVKEIRALVIPPQRGTYHSIFLRSPIPIGRGIERYGCTFGGFTLNQSKLNFFLLRASSPMFPKINLGIRATVLSLPAPSHQVLAYRITPAGEEWGKRHQRTKVDFDGHDNSLFEKVPLILTNVYSGFFLVPDGIWNYHFFARREFGRPQISLQVGHTPRCSITTTTSQSATS
jgi:pre-mRNA-processing factor 8